jgi:hypothetical protein
MEKAKPNDETKRLHGVGRDEAQQRYDSRQAERKKSASLDTNSPPDKNRSANTESAGRPIIPPLPPRPQRERFAPSIQAEAERWASTLSNTELDAIRRYQSQAVPSEAGYNDINRWLRFRSPPKGRTQKWVDDAITGLDSAIGKGRLLEPAKVIRAVRAKPDLMQAWEDALAYTIPWNDRGLISTSADPSIIPEMHGNTKLTKVVFDITLPAGTPVAFPSVATGRMKRQSEILMGRNQSFETLFIDRLTDLLRVKARLL